MNRKILALLAALMACLFLSVAGPAIQSASADPPSEEIEVPETPEGSLPPDRSARPIVPRACGTSTFLQKARTVSYFDSEGPDTVWTFRNKVWFDRCANVTIVRSVTQSYGVAGGPNPCRDSQFVDRVKMNAGDLDGWNVPAVSWDCGDTQPSAIKNIDAPNGVQIFCTNDNLIGSKVTLVRGPVQIDSNHQIPGLRVPRPTDC